MTACTEAVRPRHPARYATTSRPVRRSLCTSSPRRTAKSTMACRTPAVFNSPAIRATAPSRPPTEQPPHPPAPVRQRWQEPGTPPMAAATAAARVCCRSERRRKGSAIPGLSSRPSSLHQVAFCQREIFLCAAQHYDIPLGKTGLRVRRRAANIAPPDRRHFHVESGQIELFQCSSDRSAPRRQNYGAQTRLQLVVLASDFIRYTSVEAAE